MMSWSGDGAAPGQRARPRTPFFYRILLPSVAVGIAFSSAVWHWGGVDEAHGRAPTEAPAPNLAILAPPPAPSLAIVEPLSAAMSDETFALLPAEAELVVLAPDAVADVLESLPPAVVESVAPAVVESAAPSHSAAPAAPAASVARGVLPFRTQRDGSQWAGSNCGPAALAMVLAAWGIDQTNDELRYYTHTYQGTWGRRGGTALEHMAQVAEDFGVKTAGLYDDDDIFHRWTIQELREQVSQGRPVIVLVKYRLLPGRESSPIRYDHYVVLWDVTPRGFIYNDPIYTNAAEGFGRFMTDRQLATAMEPTLEPWQAVAFYRPS